MTRQLLQTQPAIGVKAVSWLDSWSSVEKISSGAILENLSMLSVVPILKEKAAKMLMAFCSIGVDEYCVSKGLVDRYIECNSMGYDFSRLDYFLLDKLRF